MPWVDLLGEPGSLGGGSEDIMGEAAMKLTTMWQKVGEGGNAVPDNHRGA